MSENLVLAAVERAQRHESARGTDSVSLRCVAEHLGFVSGAHTTRHLRPMLDALARDGALTGVRAFSRDQWVLSPAGRGRLRRARAATDGVELAESPQHREWRHRHARAIDGMEHYRERMREALAQAAALLDDEHADSQAWRVLSKRLGVRSELLSSAIHCAREWPEPDDARRDADDRRPLEDRRRILWHPDEDA